MQNFIALLLILMLSPIGLAIGMVQLVVFGKVFFIQTRTGKKGANFSLLKFQSQLFETGIENYQKARINSWGGFLRKTSLDELPQLINILKGEMNFVGPRPLLPEYMPLYNEEQKKRHNVKPGITGWAQVHGRHNISWNEQFELDVQYVRNKSLMLDVKILWLTFISLFKVGGAVNINRPPFNGNN